MLTTIIKSRLAATRVLLSDQGLDALLVSGSDNRRYLSGFTAREEICHESCGSLLITRDEALLLTDFRYQEWAQVEVSEFDILIYQAGLGALLIEQLETLPGGRLGFESAYLSCGQYQRLTKAAAAAGLKVMLGCMVESSVGISAAAQIAPLVDFCDLDGNLLIADDPFEGVRGEAGNLLLGDSPGIGARPRA